MTKEKPQRFADLALFPHLLSVARLVRQLLSIRLGELGVAVGQDQFLLVFEGDETVTVAEAADRLSVRPSTISKMVDRLDNKGWVVRSSDSADARRVLVNLTKAGQKMRDAVLALEAEVETQVLADLGDRGPATVTALTDLDAAMIQRLRRLR